MEQSKQQGCKMSDYQESHDEKRCEIKGGGQEMAVMVDTNHVAFFIGFGIKLNFFPLIYHNSYFLATSFDFTSFSS